MKSTEEIMDEKKKQIGVSLKLCSFLSLILNQYFQRVSKLVVFFFSFFYHCAILTVKMYLTEKGLIKCNNK